jgi:hypothetical protein
MQQNKYVSSNVQAGYGPSLFREDLSRYLCICGHNAVRRDIAAANVFLESKVETSYYFRGQGCGNSNV